MSIQYDVPILIHSYDTTPVKLQPVAVLEHPHSPVDGMLLHTSSFVSFHLSGTHLPPAFISLGAAFVVALDLENIIYLPIHLLMI